MRKKYRTGKLYKSCTSKATSSNSARPKRAYGQIMANLAKPGYAKRK